MAEIVLAESSNWHRICTNAFPNYEDKDKKQNKKSKGNSLMNNNYSQKITQILQYSKEEAMMKAMEVKLIAIHQER